MCLYASIGLAGSMLAERWLHRLFRSHSTVVSNSLSVPRSHCSSVRAVLSARPLRNAHSQMIATRQPDSSNLRRVRPSRSMFSLNFDCQNSGRVAGSVA